MVQLKYVGTKAKGTLKAPGFSLPVVKGESYDIAEHLVDSLLASGEWEKVRGQAKVEKKVEKKEAEPKKSFSYDRDSDD